MSTWTSEQLDRIGAAREVDVITSGPDGSLGEPVIVWVVRYNDDLYLRSYRGARGRWYRQAIADPHGRVRTGDVIVDVVFEHIGNDAAAEIDAAYWDKYGDLPTYVEPMVDAAATATTLRLVPAG